MSEDIEDQYRRWLAQIAEGGPRGKEAFDLFFARFQTNVLRKILSVLPVQQWGDSIQPEVAQEIWMKLWDGGAKKYNRDSPPSRWIIRVTQNHALNYIKRKDNKLKTEQIDETAESNLFPNLSEEELAESYECFNWASEQMESCCKDCEAIIRAIIIEGINNEELAERLGTTVRAATQRLYECRQCLRGLIERC